MEALTMKLKLILWFYFVVLFVKYIYVVVFDNNRGICEDAELVWTLLLDIYWGQKELAVSESVTCCKVSTGKH